jgi:hypothetical protein
LILNVLGSVAQHKREVMLEWQKEVIARAKSQGKYKGRAPTARRGRPGACTASPKLVSPSDPAAPVGGRDAQTGALIRSPRRRPEADGVARSGRASLLFRVNARFIPGRGLAAEDKQVCPYLGCSRHKTPPAESYRPGRGKFGLVI